MTLHRIQPALAYAASHLDEDVSLTALARKAGLSPYHLHRSFSETARESPKRFTMRLRLGHAAVMLLTRDDSVLEIALACGFQSHEVFSRAFRRRFGLTPIAYRKRGLTPATAAQDHEAAVDSAAPCVGLYRFESKHKSMTYTITKRELLAQPVLFTRRRVKRTEIAGAIAESLGAVFMCAQKNGIALTGQPFARYPESSIGMVTIEPGMRIAAEHTASLDDAGVIQGTLPGGSAAFTTHHGPYENLADAHAAVEAWIEAQRLTAAGAPWEIYVTDPADYPDPKDWATEIFWPLK